MRTEGCREARICCRGSCPAGPTSSWKPGAQHHPISRLCQQGQECMQCVPHVRPALRPEVRFNLQVTLQLSEALCQHRARCQCRCLPALPAAHAPAAAPAVRPLPGCARARSRQPARYSMEQEVPQAGQTGGDGRMPLANHAHGLARACRARPSCLMPSRRRAGSGALRADSA